MRDGTERLVCYLHFPVPLLNFIVESPPQPAQTVSLWAALGTVACGIALAMALKHWPAFVMMSNKLQSLRAREAQTFRVSTRAVAVSALLPDQPRVPLLKPSFACHEPRMSRRSRAKSSGFVQ